MAFLEPDRYFARLSRIDIDRDLIERGFCNVLLDVDNTILTRDTHEVPRDVGGIQDCQPLARHVCRSCGG